VATIVNEVLVVDVGNTRMKWGLRGARGWSAQGAVENRDIGRLALRDWQALERPHRAIGVNVAGEAVRVRVEGQLARWRLAMEWQHPGAEAAGVVNRYAHPAELGADRWASLAAARRRETARGDAPRPAIVVNAGTATTVDALDADGVFLGGLILPGRALMLQALAENTAALRVAPGRFEDFPKSTSDALHTGAVQAVCGAIALIRGKLAREGAVVACYLAGGGAAEIAAHLPAPLEHVDNLVLEGVLLLASRSR
jgi:type III pantothenate kinase